MEDAVRMGIGDGSGNVSHDLGGPAGSDFLSCGVDLEILAVDELHRKEVEGSLVSRRVDGNDMGMVEARHDSAFSEKSLGPLGEGKESFFEDFNGDRAMERELGRSVDAAHGAMTEKAFETKVSEGGFDKAIGHSRIIPP